MIRRKSYLVLVLLGVSLYCFHAHAYIDCKGVEVKIHSSAGAGFHGFNELGVSGAIVFTPVDPENCLDSGGALLDKPSFLVLDNIETAGGLTQFWLSMLLSAEARGAKVWFHASSLGVNTRGYEVFQAYFLALE